MTHESDPALSPAESRDLQRAAGRMIPASDEYGVPGADDPAIFADILRSLGRDTALVRAALAALAGAAYADLDAESAEAVAAQFHAAGGPAVAALGRAILQCYYRGYYRDDRVLHSLGIEARPPFPKGHIIEQGDWSLLNAVRNRKPLWRDDKAA
jgi:hypothetical protein